VRPLALLDAGDREHARCVAMVGELREDLVAPSPVLVAFITSTNTALVRAAEIEQSYESLDLGLVDAAVMVTCETLGETKVATLDRTDFTVVRPRPRQSDAAPRLVRALFGSARSPVQILELQFLTLRWIARTLPIIDAHGFVDRASV
jgi:hypothetical protein